MNKVKLIIFGANDEGKRFVVNNSTLRFLGLLEIVAFADNDSRIEGDRFEGIEIINPKRIKDFVFDYVVVVPIFFEEISSQLIDLGVDKDIIIPYYRIYKNYFSENKRAYNNVSIGKYSYYKPTTRVFNCKIGKFCHIGDNCIIGQSGHDPQCVSTYPLRYHFSKESHDTSKDPSIGKNRLTKKTIIENDVYIGEGVVIYAGVRIGNGVVVGSRAVITKDVPDYSIIGGVPAKIIRKRFSETIMEALLEIEWWNWPNSKIYNNLGSFEFNVEEFVALHGRGLIKEL